MKNCKFELHSVEALSWTYVVSVELTSLFSATSYYGELIRKAFLDDWCYR